MPYPVRDHARHTYGKYVTWPEDVRYELIDGIAYAMAPAPVRIHQELVGEMFRQIANQLEDGPCRVYVAPFDVRLPRSDEADEDIDTVVQPDIAVICDAHKLDERGCRGAPDWAIEVLSPASASHDQIRKLSVYEFHGVREYWIVHPVDRIVTVYELEQGSYGKPRIQELRKTLASVAIEVVTIDWERVARRLEPADN
ncbi:MAG: Uma2 family endonuclease [Nitrococcus sp.]|nr:Uma2 family endonuclease [Nitrococcus sp.]